MRDEHAALTKEHGALGEASAATRARLEGVEAQLAEKSATLTQKDADLRESIQTVTSMQRDHAEVIALERKRAAGFEDEARSLRERASAAEAAAAEAERRGEQARQEADAATAQLATAQASLEKANGERERLAIETAEQKDALAEGARSAERMGARLAEAEAQLQEAAATASAKTEEAESLKRANHELDVEYRSYQEHHGSSNQQQMHAISELKLTVDRLSQQYESKKEESSVAQGSLAQQSARLAELESKLLEQEAMRRDLHNTIQELKGNIRVFCRIRPVKGDKPLAMTTSQDSRLALSHNGDSHAFNFDKVFHPAASQADVFAEVDGLVQSALDGFKVCIFAYGQTGSGKTFTMEGGKEPSSWGLIPRAMSKILSLSEGMRAEGWTWTLSATFLEIYNETLRDLLASNGTQQPTYAIKHDDAWGTVVANMGRVEVGSMEQINALMEKAAKQRAVGSTDMNAQSSRSHSVFAMYLKGVNERLNTELNGALHLVDLAGSERLDKSGAVGAALKETQAINKSLSSLADVFAAKAAGNSHVPFRNSKLTHLMEPCLSGHGKTLMMVNVAPEDDNSHESLCSLRFARQVNQCDTGSAAGRQAPKPSKKQARPATAPTGAGPSKRQAK